MPRDDEKRDYIPEAASDPHLPALAPDRAENASQPELHDLRAESSIDSAEFQDYADSLYSHGALALLVKSLRSA